MSIAPSPLKKIEQEPKLVEAKQTIEPKPTTQIQPVEPIKAPEPVQLPVEAPKPVATSCEAEISKYNWDQGSARRVMMQESSNDHLILNDNPSTGDYSVGCFQINLYGNLAYSRPTEAWLKDPVNNVQYAYNLWKSHNGSFWSSWPNTCRKVGCY